MEITRDSIPTLGEVFKDLNEFIEGMKEERVEHTSLPVLKKIQQELPELLSVEEALRELERRNGGSTEIKKRNDTN